MTPNYSLEKIKEFAGSGGDSVIMTKRASTEALNEFGYSFQDVLDVVLELQESDFFKADVSKETGLPIDAYKKRLFSTITQKHHMTYIKFQITQKLVVISFHTDTVR